MADPVSELQLENAGLDADALGHFVNDGASPGTYETRTGRVGKTLAYLESLTPPGITGSGGLIITGVVGSGGGTARPDAGLEIQHDASGHALLSIYQTQVGIPAGSTGQAPGQEESGMVFMGRDAAGTICHMGSLSSIWASATAGVARMCMRIATTYNSGNNEDTTIALYGGQGMVIFSPNNGTDLVGPGAAPGPNQLGIIGSVGIGANPVAKPSGAGCYLYLEGYGTMFSQHTGSGSTANESITNRITIDGSPSLSGSLIWGVEGHTGGELLTGTAPYDAVGAHAPSGCDLWFGGNHIISFGVKSSDSKLVLAAPNHVDVGTGAISFGTGNAPGALGNSSPSKFASIRLDDGNVYVFPLWR